MRNSASKAREQIVIFSKKHDDPQDVVLVFFPPDEKLGLQLLLNYTNRMIQEDVKRGIIVAQGPLTAVSKRQMPLLEKEGVILEIFQQKELLVNITHHVLVPSHTVLTRNEKKILLQRYKVKETQLPRIQFDDPVARYYGMRRGQVARIVRPSETAGRYVTYRLC